MITKQCTKEKKRCDYYIYQTFNVQGVGFLNYKIKVLNVRKRNEYFKRTYYFRL